MHSLKHRFEPLFAQMDRQFGRLFGCVALCVEEASVLAGVGETRQSLPGEFGKTKVPASDQVGFGMRRKPVAAPQQELVYLVGADPVVLGVVEHREQHVEMLQGRTHGMAADQSSRHVTHCAPASSDAIRPIERDRRFYRARGAMQSSAYAPKRR